MLVLMLLIPLMMDMGVIGFKNENEIALTARVVCHVGCRTYTRCTETSSSIILQTSNNSAPRRGAKSKECTARIGSSLFKDIQSSTRTL